MFWQALAYVQFREIIVGESLRNLRVLLLSGDLSDTEISALELVAGNISLRHSIIEALYHFGHGNNS